MDFKPSFFLKNRHIQTLYAPLFKKKGTLRFQKECFSLSDGDFLELYWYQKERSKHTVVLLHGLDGSYRSAYIQSLMEALSDNGFASVLMHFRGCATLPNNKERSYHSGDTQDFKEVVSYLHNMDRTLYATGFSLGANVLLKYLAQERKNANIKAAVAVSPPMKLDVCATAMDRGFSRLYQFMLLKNLKRMVLKKHATFELLRYGITEEKIKQVKNFREFDELYTAPVHGFESAQEYYMKCSSFGDLHKIKTPTLIVHAKDDPFMRPDVIPKQEDVGEYVELEIHEHGGHVGFVAGTPFKPVWWIDKRCVEFLKEVRDKEACASLD